MQAEKNYIVATGFLLVTIFWNLKLHKPLEVIFPPAATVYALGALLLILGVLLSRKPAKISAICLFIIIIPTAISWALSNSLGYKNTYFYEFCYATITAISADYINEQNFEKIAKLIFYSIGILAIILFVAPEYYIYFDVNAFERPTFSMVRAGGPMLSSNEMPLAMVVLYLGLAHLKKDNAVMIILMIIAVALSQSKAAAIGVFICLLSQSFVTVKKKFLVAILMIAAAMTALDSKFEDIFEVSRFSINNEDSRESTKLRGEAISNTFSQMQISPLSPQEFEYLYPVIPHVTIMSPVAKFGIFFGGLISASVIIGLFLTIRKSRSLGLAIALFTFTEPVLYIIPSAVLAVTLVARSRAPR